MSTIVKAIFRMSSWTMDTPVPYSAFHLLFGGAGILSAIYLALRFSGKCPRRVLFTCGLILSAAELYKQGFLYYIVNGGQYDWWYFPFQLCSIPMYLCLLLPLLNRLAAGRCSGTCLKIAFRHKRIPLCGKSGPDKEGAAGYVDRIGTNHTPTGGMQMAGMNSQTCSRAVYTFMQDYALLGGFMALAEPSGLMHPYAVLTFHGFIWHFILIFIGLTCALTGEGGRSLKDFTDTLPLFLGCAVIATVINVASHPYGNADMFYISPYYPNGQIVFHQISLTIGTIPGNLLYLLSVILGGFLIHLGAGRIRVRKTQ